MSNDNINYQAELARIYRQNGLGTLDARVAESIYGINYRANGLFIPTSTDQNGLTFFVKTDMNLQEGNVSHDRNFSDLITPDPVTYQRAIRALLDPYGATMSDYGTPLVNNKSPFIVPLTNTLVSVSGFPDNVMGAYVSPEGIMGEAYAMVDGVYKIRGPYSLTCTFTNIEGGIISRLFDTWGLYMEGVLANRMNPYPWNNAMNLMDYTTRIWRLILDPSRRYVRHIGYTGYCFPKVNPQGGIFNFDMEQNFDTSNSKISIEFQAVGAVYNDPLAPFIFNYLQYMFNPDLAIVNMGDIHKDDIQIRGSSRYYRVTQRNMDALNHWCYPLIHPHTRELCWYIEKEVFHELTGVPRNYTTAVSEDWQPPLV